MLSKLQKTILFITAISIFIASTVLTAYAGTPQVEDNIYVAVGYSKTIPCSLDNCQGKRKNWSAASKYFTISSTGTLKGISQGNGTATISTESGESKTCNVYVTPAANLSSKIGKVKLIRGKSKKINVTISPQNACSDLIWNSSNSNIATVENGLVTATGLGKCDIYCKTNDGGSGYLSISVTVSNPSTTSPTVSKKIQTTKKHKVTTTKKRVTHNNTVHSRDDATKLTTVATTKKSTTHQNISTQKNTTNNLTNNSTNNLTNESTTLETTTENVTVEDDIYYTGSNEMQDYDLKGISKKKSPIKIEWDKIKGATGYQLFCSFDMKNFALIYDGTNNFYEQHHFQNGKTYYYFVRSYKVENGIKITDYNSDVLVQKSVGKGILSKII